MSHEDASNSEEPIQLEQMDANFKNVFSKVHGGENIKRCFTCGTCSVACPVFEVEPSYDPRKVIRMILLGMKDEVLKSKLIWMCSGCYSCQELCPRDVKITNIMAAARNLAVKEGYVPDGIRGSVEQLEKYGRLLEVSEFENNMRTKKDILKLIETLPEINGILKNTGLTKLIKEGGKNE